MVVSWYSEIVLADTIKRTFHDQKRELCVETEFTTGSQLRHIARSWRLILEPEDEREIGSRSATSDDVREVTATLAGDVDLRFEQGRQFGGEVGNTTQKPRILGATHKPTVFLTKPFSQDTTYSHLLHPTLSINHLPFDPYQNTHSSTSKHTANMSNTVNVKGISHETTEKEVRDFFSFW